MSELEFKEFDLEVDICTSRQKLFQWYLEEVHFNPKLRKMIREKYRKVSLNIGKAHIKSIEA